MTLKEFYNHLNNQEAGYHLLSFGAQPKYQDNRRSITLDLFSCIDATGLSPIIWGDIEFSALTRKGCISSRNIEFSIGICTKTKNSDRKEVMIFGSDNMCCDVMADVTYSDALYYAFIFIGKDNSTGEDTLGILYCNSHKKCPQLQFALSSDAGFQNMLVELYNHIVSETIKSCKLNSSPREYSYPGIEEGEDDIYGK